MVDAIPRGLVKEKRGLLVLKQPNRSTHSFLPKKILIKLPEWCTPNCLMLVKTTAIAYGQKIDQSLRTLVVCNSSHFYKRQAIGSKIGVIHLTKLLYRCYGEPSDTNF